MPKKYRSGFERLGRYYSDTTERYAEALRSVRENFNGFEDFNGYDQDNVHNFTPAQKKQIRRYYNTATEYTEGEPVYKMPIDELPPEILGGGRYAVEAVMKAAQMPRYRKSAKFVFIKLDGETIPEIRVKNGSPVFVNRRLGYMREVIELNTVELARDAMATILSAAPLVEGASFFRILNGRHEFYGPRGSGAVAGDLHSLANEVIMLQEKYGIHTKDNWQRWLYGISAYYVDGSGIELRAKLKNIKVKFREKVKREKAKLMRVRK